MQTNKFFSCIEYTKNKIDSLIFKFAVYSIMISALLLFQVELFTFKNNKTFVENNSGYDTLAHSFLKIKALANFFLIIICASCRTMFDITEIPAFFERYCASFLFLTILTLISKYYYINLLTEPYKQILNYEVAFIPILFSLTILALTTWTPYKSLHIKQLF